MISPLIPEVLRGLIRAASGLNAAYEKLFGIRKANH
jgi:hypothetical protein